MSDHSKPSRPYSRANQRYMPIVAFVSDEQRHAHQNAALWPEEPCLAAVGTVVESHTHGDQVYETRVMSSFTVPLVRTESPIMRRVYTVGLYVDGVFAEKHTRTWFQASMEKALDKMKGETHGH